jgi:DNA-binding beta-propeller fold protein YncE
VHLLVVLLAIAAGPQGDAVPYRQAERTVTDLRPELVLIGGYYSGPFEQVNGVFCDDRTGEIYVADVAANAIQVFDEKGSWLFAFSDSEHLDRPFRMVVDREGRIHVIDGDRSRIKVFSYRGEFLSYLEVPGVKEPDKAVFSAIAIDRNGDFAVGETKTGEIFLFDATGRLKLHFGGYGAHDGQFQGIAGIALDDERIYVASADGVAIQVFSRNGRFLRGWGQHARGKENVSNPVAVAVDPKGRVVLLDSLRHEIKYFDATGALIDIFGGAGDAPGAVSFPTALMIDARGRVCLSDSGNERVQVLSPVEADAAPGGAAPHPPP